MARRSVHPPHRPAVDRAWWSATLPLLGIDEGELEAILEYVQHRVAIYGRGEAMLVACDLLAERNARGAA